MKRLMVVLAVLVSAACGKLGGGVAGPSDPGVSANGSLPSWMFSYNGHLVRPEAGTVSVFAGPEITGDADLNRQFRAVLSAATAFTRGQVVFTSTGDSGAAVAMRINPNDSRFSGNTSLGTGTLAISGYRITRDDIAIRSPHDFLSNVPLHELGHFILGPGHSSDPADLMNPNRSDYASLSFSAQEQDIWNRSLALPPGATQ